MLRTIKGDLFKSDEIDGFSGNINTACCVPHGFTMNAKRRLGDWADPYGHRTAMKSKYGNVLNLCLEEQRYIPGTILVQEAPESKTSTAAIKYALWLVAQLDMSTPLKYNRFKSEYKDTAANREIWFAEALDKVGIWCAEWSKEHEDRRFRLGMSNETGCGLAQGNLKNYQRMMQEFAAKYKSVVELIWFEYK